MNDHRLSAAASPGVPLGISWAIGWVGALTFISGAIVAVAMREPQKVGRASAGSGGSRGISRSHG